MTIRPASGSSRPRIWLISVVLPAPLGPSSPKTSPAPTSSEMASLARMPLRNFLVTRSTSSNTGSLREVLAAAHDPVIDALQHVIRSADGAEDADAFDRGVS